MKICSTSNNFIVKSSKVKRFSERSSKVRRKETSESNKIEKPSKCDIVIACSKYDLQECNKRGCPTRDQPGSS